jgi:hypothetical protein
MQAEHRPGDIQLCRVAFPGGTIIRILQWLNKDGFADFEHARVYLGDGLFAEAMPKGAIIAAHDLDEPGCDWDSGLYPLTDAQRAGTVAAARSYVAAGIGYNWLDYGSLVLKRLHIRPAFVLRRVRSLTSMICSQFACRCRFDGGAPFWDEWTGDCTPGDIEQLIEARRHGSGSHGPA